MFSKVRMLPAGLIPIAATMIFAAGNAHASLLTDTAQSCGTPQDSQVFLPWSDPSEYFLAPDGNLANPTTGWSLNGGASVVAGGDGYSLGGSTPSTQSLALPDGSSATSPGVCAGIADPTMRFFAKNSGSPSSSLLVTATVQTALGLNLTLPIADISGTSTWNPSAVIPIVENLIPALPGNATPITFTFTPLGHGGGWQIDDLYVDPWTRGG